MTALAAPAALTRSPRLSQGVTLTSVFVGLAVGYPSVFGATSTAFVLPLTHAFGWGRLVPSLMFTSAMLGVCLASLVLGRVIERIGVPVTAAVSAVGLGVALLLLSRLTGSRSEAFAIAFVAGLLGSGTGVGLYVTIVPRQFSRRLGLALGVAVVGQSLGSILMPWLVVSTTASAGWRTAYVLLAVVHVTVSLVVAVAIGTILRQRSTQAVPCVAADGTAPGAASRTSAFWGLAFVIFLQTLAMFGITVHLFPIYADRGVAAAHLPMLVLLVSIGMALGRLGAGLLLDRADARRVAATLFALGAAGIAWLALTKAASRLEMWGPTLLIGLALGGESDILAYLARRYFGLRHYAVIYNRLLIGFFLGSMVGPLVLGWSFDNLPRGPLALWLLAASAGLAAVSALALPPTRRPLYG